jgi:hypothetical protein
MNLLDQEGARRYLRAHRVASRSIEDIVGAFDFAASVYEQTLDGGTEIFQYVRNPAHGDMSPRLGNWFCIRGATQDGLAIFGGGSGRHIARFVVSHAVTVLEGTATPMHPNWSYSIGGGGGATQIYVPTSLVGHLACAGPHAFQ